MSRSSRRSLLVVRSIHAIFTVVWKTLCGKLFHKIIGIFVPSSPPPTPPPACLSLAPTHCSPRVPTRLFRTPHYSWLKDFSFKRSERPLLVTLPFLTVALSVAAGVPLGSAQSTRITHRRGYGEQSHPWSFARLNSVLGERETRSRRRWTYDDPPASVSASSDAVTDAYHRAGRQGSSHRRLAHQERVRHEPRRTVPSDTEARDSRWTPGLYAPQEGVGAPAYAAMTVAR